MCNFRMKIRPAFPIISSSLSLRGSLRACQSWKCAQKAKGFDIRIIAVILACMVFATAANAQSANSQNQQITKIHDLKKQLFIGAQELSSSSQTPTTAQIKSLIKSAERYFSARTAYQKVLFKEILKDGSSLYSPRTPNIKERDSVLERADASLKTKNSILTTQEALLPIFQKYFSPNAKLSLSGLMQCRNLLRQIAALNKGHLSGSVWLYDSALSAFAISHLETIDPRIIKTSLSRAKYLRTKHQYSAAQKLYKNLLTQYMGTLDAPRIQVLLTNSIVEGYNYQSDHYLKKHDFKQARTYLHKIIDAYPKTQYSTAAQKKLEATVPISVDYFQREGDANFKPVAKMGVPQNKSAIYYSKMYSEDPNGPKAPYALYYWARALGTKGEAAKEVKLLDEHLKKFPKSKMRAQVMYLLGFVYSSQLMRNYKTGIPLLLQVVNDFPQSPESPESLWNAAFILGWNHKYQQAIPLLQQLKAQYPKSPRVKWVDEWIAKYKEGG